MRHSPGAVPLALLAAALAFSMTAAAHATYLSSQPSAGAILPTAPTSVSVQVSESIGPGTANMIVTDSQGGRHEVNGTRTSSLDPRLMWTDVQNMGPGIFTVTWRAVSAEDGHASVGSFSFGVQDRNGTVPGQIPPTETGAQSSPISPADVLLRGASAFSAVSAVGAVAFALFVWRPSMAGLSTKRAKRPTETLRTVFLWGMGNAMGLAAYSLGWLAWSLASTGGGGTDPLAGSVFLQSLATRAALAAILAGLMALLWLRPRLAVDPEHAGWVLLSAFLVGFALLYSIAAASHSAASPDTGSWGALADAGHLTFASMWGGGLLSLLVAHHALAGPENAAFARHALPRFSRMATVASAGVIAAGALLSLVLVQTPQNLVSTPYGSVLVAKIALVGTLLALGAHNHFRSIPLLTDPTRVVEAAAKIARNVRLEAVFATAVLAVAGLLTAMVPSVSYAPPLAPPPAFQLTQVQDGIQIDFEVYPPPQGPSVYVVSVLLYDDATGGLYENATNATLTFVLTNSTLPHQDVPMEGPHSNHFFVETSALSQAGQWRVDVHIRRSDGFDIIATFYIQIRGGDSPA